MSENENGQLTEKQIEELENLDAETFDLNDFLDQKWEFPAFTATVYLDGSTATRINEIDTEVKKLQHEIKEAQKEAKNQGYTSLGGAVYADTDVQENRLAELRTEREELADSFRSSSLKFIFQLPESSDNIHKKATEMAKAKFPNVKDVERDDEASTYRGKCLMVMVVKGIFNHKGAKFGGQVDVDMMEKLYAKLVPVERQKLETNMVLAISGGDVMRRAADAGFPG